MLGIIMMLCSMGMLCIWTRFKDGIAMNLENNLEYIKESLRTILKLEYLGVHIEGTKEKDFKQLYYFSVPERSALQVETAKDLIDVAKTTLTKLKVTFQTMFCSSKKLDKAKYGIKKRVKLL